MGPLHEEGGHGNGSNLSLDCRTRCEADDKRSVIHVGKWRCVAVIRHKGGRTRHSGGDAGRPASAGRCAGLPRPARRSPRPSYAARLSDAAVVSQAVSEASLADATKAAADQELIPRASGLCTPPKPPSNVPVVPRDQPVGQPALALRPPRPRSVPSTWRTADDRTLAFHSRSELAECGATSWRHRAFGRVTLTHR